MTGCVVARDEADLTRRAAAVMARIGAGGSEDAWLQSMSERWIVGTVAQVVDRIRAYEEVGVQRVLLQHHAHTDLDMIRLVGAEVVTAVA
jgi:alkanesulfonate monooxygenase SsuD/methylene tetrahydromethanopterin reductase-like flavin-dependent oxidoreductase (luciferase family)